MKVKSESEVAQSCPTLRDPTMDCSLPGSSVHGIFQARVSLPYNLAIPVLGSIKRFTCTKQANKQKKKKKETWSKFQQFLQFHFVYFSLVTFKWNYVMFYLKKRYDQGNGTPLQYSCLENPMDGGAWKAAVHGVTRSRTWLSDFTFPFHFHALEKEMATHSSVLAWRIPGTGEPGGLPSLGSHRIRHDWSDLA